MKTRLLPAFLFLTLLLSSLFLHAQSSCCGVPDSLKVTNITSSGYCLTWRVNDSVRCDSPKGFQLQIKPASSSTWATRTKAYPAGAKTYTICDSTSSACTNYQWRVRNICIKNGDTTFSVYVNGPNFKTSCLGGKTANTTLQSTVKVYPNPAYDKIIIKATMDKVTSAKVMITNLNGKIMFEKQVSLLNGSLEVPLSIARFDKNVYFVTVSDGKTIVKSSFTKE